MPHMGFKAGLQAKSLAVIFILDYVSGPGCRGSFNLQTVLSLVMESTGIRLNRGCGNILFSTQLIRHSC